MVPHMQLVFKSFASLAFPLSYRPGAHCLGVWLRTLLYQRNPEGDRESTLRGTLGEMRPRHPWQHSTRGTRKGAATLDRRKGGPSTVTLPSLFFFKGSFMPKISSKSEIQLWLLSSNRSFCLCFSAKEPFLKSISFPGQTNCRASEIGKIFCF